MPALFNRRVRMAAIDFLNPAPLMWSFEHEPSRVPLAARYAIEKMTPAACAERLRTGDADLGLIPIAAYAEMPGLAVVPGCAIASLGAIRSILLVLRGLPGEAAQGDEFQALTEAVRMALGRVKSVALDTSSRASAMYTRILFRKYWGLEPRFLLHAPALDTMLKSADAALLIGDPALYALRDRAEREARTGERLIYLDLGLAWRLETGVPWVSAFWAADPEGLARRSGETAREVVADLAASRDAGLANVAALAEEWSARLGLARETVEEYLGSNIHYRLDEACLAGVDRFYADAVECELLERAPALTFL